MDRYGSDKPDLRIPLELVSVDDLMQQVEFKVFRGPADDPAGRVAALKVPGGASISRKEIDDYTKYVSIYGARGLAWIKVNDVEAGVEGLQSPILKFMPDEVVAQMMERLGAANGDIIFFGADRARVVNEALGALRVKVAEDQGMVAEGWAPLWVVDFPMFEEDGEGGWTPLHHPFTAPSCDAEELAANPVRPCRGPTTWCLTAVSWVAAVFVFTSARCRNRFSVFWTLMRPRRKRSLASCSMPCSTARPPRWPGVWSGPTGNADDRRHSIRDVIAFPKTQSAHCVMTNAPGDVGASSCES